jgi:hypothetical protein
MQPVGLQVICFFICCCGTSPCRRVCPSRSTTAFVPIPGAMLQALLAVAIESFAAGSRPMSFPALSRDGQWGHAAARGAPSVSLYQWDMRVARLRERLIESGVPIDNIWFRNPYFLAAEHRPSIFFTDDTRIRCAPSAAPAIFPERTSPSAGATVPATSTRCPSSCPNSASWPVSA